MGAHESATGAGDDAATAAGDDAANAVGGDAAEACGDDAANACGDDAAKAGTDDAAERVGDVVAKTASSGAAKTVGGNSIAAVGDVTSVGDDGSRSVGVDEPRVVDVVGDDAAKDTANDPPGTVSVTPVSYGVPTPGNGESSAGAAPRPSDPSQKKASDKPAVAALQQANGRRLKLFGFELAVTPHFAVALSNAGFLVLLMVMLRGRWWIGSTLAQCGHEGYPLVKRQCACEFTMPYICWFSECINGLYGLQPGQTVGMVRQSVLWVALSAFPAASGVWLFRKRRRPLDAVVGLLSCVYLAVGLFPDTLPQPLTLVHYFFAVLALAAAFALQFKAPRPGARITLTMYVMYYFVLSEMLILEGVDRVVAYDWLVEAKYPFPVIIAEWALIFGATTVAIVYCVISYTKGGEQESWSSNSQS